MRRALYIPVLVISLLVSCETADDEEAKDGSTSTVDADGAKDGSTSTGDAAAASKTGTVSGTVVCSCSSTVKIPNVTVAIGAISSQTDIQGVYKLQGVPVGKQTITAKGSPHHHDYSGQIDVKEGANTFGITMDLK